MKDPPQAATVQPKATEWRFSMCWRMFLPRVNLFPGTPFVIYLHWGGFRDQSRHIHMSNHGYLGFTKVVYGMLDLLVYHQYSLVNEIGPPHKRDTFV